MTRRLPLGVRAFAVALTLLALGALLAAPASAAVTNQETFALAFTTYPTQFLEGRLVRCGEDIAFTGTDHEVARATASRSGGTEVGGHTNIQLTGVGLATGTVYRLNYTINYTINVNNPGKAATVSKELHNIEVIGQGQAPNLKGQTLLHITVNANGTVTAHIDTITFTCR